MTKTYRDPVKRSESEAGRRHGGGTVRDRRNPFGEAEQARDRVVLLDGRDARLPYEDYEPPGCSLCDALGHGYPGGGPCPLESPDPGYYADELAAGR